MTEVRKSNCHQCGYLCGVLAWVDGQERIEKVAPDPDRYPCDPSLMNRCKRFAVLLDHLNHSERVNYPLKRIGARGSGKWRRVGWQQALDDIAARVKDLGAQYGPESLCTCISAPHAIYWPLHRFMNLWGSPNNVGIGISCWNPRVWVNSLTCGWPTEDEIDLDHTRCVMVWAMNPAQSDHSLFWKTLNSYCQTDGKIIVIDPRRTATARLADHWLKIIPGTDGALALGMLHVIIQERIYDHAFVASWCSGFNALCERVKSYPVEKVSKITGLDADEIVKAARQFATSKPAAIFTGLGIDASGANCTQTLRSIAILRAVTGNLDAAGASFINESPDFVPEAEMELSHMLPEQQREKKLGKGLFALQRYSGYERLTAYTKQHGKQLPARYLTSAHPHLAWQAMISSKPYPVRALITMASNPLLCQANTPMVYEALKGLDFMVTLEHYMTPTAMLADYVLPMAGSLEKAMVQTNGGIANVAYGGPAAIKPLFERRTGFDFWRELGIRCGQAPFWPWRTLEQALDEMLAPANLSWDSFCQEGLYAPARTYQKYLTKGFATPSGKVELASSLLEKMGHDPLPDYAPVALKDPRYPLALITGARKQPYYASEFRQMARLRRRHCGPLAQMSPATASRLELSAGDVIWIETPGGRIQQKLSLAQMRDDLVSADYGWWFPEQPADEPVLGGLWQSNANVLTTADPALCDPILGQWSFRPLGCKVYKAESPMNRITIRNAGENDRDALIALLWQNTMVHAEPLSDYLLALDGNNIVGCLRLEEHDDLIMIRPVVVDRSSRKRGVGRRLVENIPRLDKPWAVAARGDAIAFYEAMGFTKTKWGALPAGQVAECRHCPDNQQCRPRPMIRDPKHVNT